MLTAALTVLGLYLLTTGCVALFQRQMIYHPTTLNAQSLAAQARTAGLDPWLNAAGQRIGWKRLSRAQPPQGRVLVTHGNAGCAVDRSDYALALQDVAPFDVFILEYPGYGDRPGAPSERTLFAAGEEALASLPAGAPVFLLGESLGSGVAAYLAGTQPERVAGLLLIAPFDNLAHLAQHHMPIFPVRWVLRDRFTSDAYLTRYAGPLGVLLAGRDEVVPNRFGRRLYDGYAGPKRLWETPGARHNEVYNQAPEFWRGVVAFWLGREGARAATE
jgi:hypothetical protein